MDDYPTNSELKKVKKWPHDDFYGLMDFIKSIWWMPDFGFRKKGKTYTLATGGWSGNESIIQAMQANFMFWAICWVSSKRGGHFVFRLPANKHLQAEEKEEG